MTLEVLDHLNYLVLIPGHGKEPTAPSQLRPVASVQCLTLRINWVTSSGALCDSLHFPGVGRGISPHSILSPGTSTSELNSTRSSLLHRKAAPRPHGTPGTQQEVGGYTGSAHEPWPVS